MDVSNHESGNLLSCCVKDSPLRRGLYLIDLHPTIFNGLSCWAASEIDPSSVTDYSKGWSHRTPQFFQIYSFYVLLLTCAQKGPLVQKLRYKPLNLKPFKKRVWFARVQQWLPTFSAALVMEVFCLFKFSMQGLEIKKERQTNQHWGESQHYNHIFEWEKTLWKFEKLLQYKNMRSWWIPHGF